jgi:hypothetical protein
MDNLSITRGYPFLYLEFLYLEFVRFATAGKISPSNTNTTGVAIFITN